MGSAANTQEPGGFLPPTLPSPPVSSVNSPAPARSILPTPRSRPLKPGSSKESDFINYTENKLLAISRHYENRFSAQFSGEENPDVEGRGYKDIGEVLRDLDQVVDVVWISGTRKTLTRSCSESDAKLNVMYSCASNNLPPYHRSHGDHILNFVSFLATTDI